jgi:tetratricopeptide (TPR) repeat protein
MDEARLNVASVFLDYLDYARSLKQFQAVRKRFPKHYQAMVGEADSLYGVGNYEEAVALYLETLRMKDDNPEAVLRVGKIYEQQLNKPKDALSYYKRYVALAEPPKTDKIYQTIMLLEQAGQMQMKTQGGADAPAAGAAPAAAAAPAGDAAQPAPTETTENKDAEKSEPEEKAPEEG